ncbi:MAG: GAF domain-containing protein, partial [Cyanobacteria bacterium J06641_5]
MNLDSAAHHDELSKRDALLRGVAEAAQLLLASADFDAAVNGALEAIATTADIDRIYIFENQLDPKTGAEVAYCPYEWTVPGIVKMREIPNRFPMVLSLFGRVTQELRAGRSVQVLARELPEPARALQALDTAVSLSIVPIVMSDGTWWGAIGCDDCTTERVWSDAEVAVLETAAACIGSAIERDRARAEREAAAQVGAAELETHNQQLRERDSLLNCVNAAAQCLVANDDLSVALPA